MSSFSASSVVNAGGVLVKRPGGRWTPGWRRASARSARRRGHGRAWRARRGRLRADGERRLAGRDLVVPQPQPERRPEPLRIEQYPRACRPGARCARGTQPLRGESRLTDAEADATRPVEQPLDARHCRLGFRRRDDGERGHEGELDPGGQGAKSPAERPRSTPVPERAVTTRRSSATSTPRIPPGLAEPAIESVRQLRDGDRCEPIREVDVGTGPDAHAGENASDRPPLEGRVECLVDERLRTQLAPPRRGDTPAGRHEADRPRDLGRCRTHDGGAPRPHSSLRPRHRRWSSHAGASSARRVPPHRTQRRAAARARPPARRRRASSGRAAVGGSRSRGTGSTSSS